MTNAILDNVTRVFSAQRAGDPEEALLRALLAVAGTSAKLSKLHGRVESDRARYVKFLRAYYWVMEPMLGVGLNLQDTRFDNIPFDRLPHWSPPDIAEVIYEKHRCTRAHGDDVPLSLELIAGTPGDYQWEVAHNHLRMPTSLIWALTASVVLCHVNHRIRSTGDMHLTLGDTNRHETFMVADWWGRESEFRIIAERWNNLRVTMIGLAGMEPLPSDRPLKPEEIEKLIFNPPPPAPMKSTDPRGIVHPDDLSRP